MFAKDIKKITKENTDFRRVLRTGKYSQIVAMNIVAGEEIGMETHEDVDQLLIIVEGKGKAIINDEERYIDKNDIIFVPAGAKHNFINIGEKDMKLITVYAPPEHPKGTVHETKNDAMKSEGHHDTALELLDEDSFMDTIKQEN